MITVGIDPGKPNFGIALFNDAELIKAECLKILTDSKDVGEIANAAAGLALRWAGPLVDVVVMERMQSYPGSPVPVNRLQELSVIAAMISGALRPERVLAPFPREWKGTLDGDVMTQRLLALLSADERGRIVQRGALTHNAVDAAGLGLWYLGRFNGFTKIRR